MGQRNFRFNLVLMAAYRAERLGYSTDDLVAFLRAVGGSAAAQAAGE